jgi:hypothetical protein
MSNETTTATKMNNFKIFFEDNNSFVTGFNGDLNAAKSYYLNKLFNLGVENDRMVKCVAVIQVE